MMNHSRITRQCNRVVLSSIPAVLLGLVSLVLLPGQLCLSTAAPEESSGTEDTDASGTSPDTGVPSTDTFVGENVLGSASAPVTVIDYSDFEDPVSGRFARETLPTIGVAYINTGQVRWVFRHFPVRSIHPLAQDAAEASECAADQNRFFAYRELLFNNQGAFSNSELKIFAAQLALDQGTFFACLDSGSKAADVQEDINSGLSQGVTTTPAFLIQDELHTGFMTATEFGALLDDAIDEANQADSASDFVGPLP